MSHEHGRGNAEATGAPSRRRWLIARDRGQAVRTQNGYEALARPLFPQIESVILHDTLRLPYTILVMRCVRAD